MVSGQEGQHLHFTVPRFHNYSQY